MKELEHHEAANIFPLDDAFIAVLAEDIRRHGLKEPIETCGGKVLDGRHRYGACKKAGVEPRFVEVKTDDPVRHVVARNLMRYHHDASVRAMAAAAAGALAEQYRREAAERKSAAGGDRKSARAKSVGELVPQPIGDTGKSRDRLGADFGVSGKYVQMAAKVVESGTPELAEAARQGRISVRKAAALADQPEEVQRMEVSRPKTKRSPRANGAAPAPADATQPAPGADPKAIRARGKAVELAHEAINRLSRIPRTNHYRSEALRMVARWLKKNR